MTDGKRALELAGVGRFTARKIDEILAQLRGAGPAPAPAPAAATPLPAARETAAQLRTRLNDAKARNDFTACVSIQLRLRRVELQEAKARNDFVRCVEIQRHIQALEGTVLQDSNGLAGSSISGSNDAGVLVASAVGPVPPAARSGHVPAPAHDAVATPALPPEIQALKVVELKANLEALRQKRSGNKPELRARLLAALMLPENAGFQVITSMGEYERRKASPGGLNPNLAGGAARPVKRRRRDYVPRPKSGPWALLLSLEAARLEPSYPGFLTKKELIARATPLATHSFEARPPDYYSAWSSMKALIDRGYVRRWSNPAKFDLTTLGLELAVRLKAEAGRGEMGGGAPRPTAVAIAAPRQPAAAVGSPRQPNTAASSPRSFSRASPRAQNIFNAGRSSLRSIDMKATRRDTQQHSTSSASRRKPAVSGSRIRRSQSAMAQAMVAAAPRPTLSRPGLSRSTSAPTALMGTPELHEEIRINLRAHQGARRTVLPRLPQNMELVLLIDVREMKSRRDRNYFAENLLKLGVPVIKRALPVGDAMWIARPVGSTDMAQEVVLGFIVERKQLEDLAQSIRSKRLVEQRTRLCAMQMQVTYIVEGDDKATFMRDGPAMDTVLARMDSAFGFHVHWTRSSKDTVWVLWTMTQAIAKQLAEAGGAPALRMLPAVEDDIADATAAELRAYLRAFRSLRRDGRNGAGPGMAAAQSIPELHNAVLREMGCVESRGMSYFDWKSRAKKTRDETVTRKFGEQLRMVTSIHKASALLEKFPTASHLQSAYNKLQPSMRPLLLAGTRFGSEGSRVGPAESKKLWAFFCAKDYFSETALAAWRPSRR